MMQSDDFTEWLEAELEERGWSQRELSRLSGLSSASVSNVISGQQEPGLKFYSGVAEAFGLPLDVILRKAGLLPLVPESDMILGQIHYYLSELPREEQTRFLLMARSIWEHYKAQPAAEEMELAALEVGEPEVVALDNLESVLFSLLKDTSDTFKEAVITTVRAWLTYREVS